VAGPEVSTEKPLSPLCGICGIDDPLDDSIELEENGESEEAGAIIQGGTEAIKLGKDSDEREVRKLIDPRKPTKEEVDLHDMFHSPYRNWCAICVKAIEVKTWIIAKLSMSHGVYLNTRSIIIFLETSLALN